ncbi:FKBP-type peptidyl-prolyl cis-trans isomerase SlyD [bacterium BMS3Bbin14]|nr:FKBP-type peptidyl-prolyl cis-trans isomerase SlyD [bacterium BMS3Bbin14]HDK43602.1 peptidylprolyl isomerase [Desulfobacteraceae bacterium]
MKITDKLYVAMDYKLSLASGEEVDSSPPGEPLGFIAGAGQIIPGLERELMGMAAGESSRVTVEHEDAYGPVIKDMFQEIPRGQFPDDVKVEPGMTFHAQGPHGQIVMSVTELKDNDVVVVDLNHPLAGQQLFFDVNIVEVREPSAEELSQVQRAQQQEEEAGGCGCGSTDQSDCGPGCSCG